jgi:hypothetical protein
VIEMTRLAKLAQIGSSALRNGRRRLVFGGAVVVAIGISGAALAQITTTAHHQAGPSAPPPPTITAPPATGHSSAAVSPPAAIPAELMANFEIFRRADTTSDAPDNTLGQQLSNSLPGPALKLARKIDGSDGRTYFIIPAANDLVCVASAGGGACGDSRAVAQSGLIESDVCVAGQPDEIRIVGLTPDGVDHVQVGTASGSKTVDVKDNLYVALFARDAPPDGVSWQSPNGQRVINQPVNLPADVAQSC